MSACATISVLIVEDDPLIAEAHQAYLGRLEGFSVAAVAHTARDAMRAAATAAASEHPVDLVLLDIGMPGLSSFEATRQIKKNRPETKILFLTMYDDEDYLVEGMEVGASGYVLKDSPSTQLVAAMRDVIRGGSYLSPRMLSQLVDDFRSRIKSANRSAES